MRIQNFGNRCAIIVGAVIVLAGVSHGQTVVYQNGSADGVNAFDLTARVGGDDIELVLMNEGPDEFFAPITFNRVRFWTLEEPGAFKGTIQYDLGYSVDWEPGNQPRTLATNLTRTATGVTRPNFPGLQEYIYEFDVPAITVVHQSMWLTLHNGALEDLSNTGFIGWETTDTQRGGFGTSAADAPFFDDWGYDRGDRAFELIAVPEPTSAIICTALGGSLALKRRRAR